MNIEVVPRSLVHTVWPDVKEFIERSIEWSDEDFTIDQVRAKVAEGSWMLLIAADEKIKGAMVINLYNDLNDRTAFILATGGSLIIDSSTYQQLCGIAKQFGATRIQAAVRPSMERLLQQHGFKERYKIVEAKL